MKKILIVGDTHFGDVQRHLMSELLEKFLSLMKDVELVFVSQAKMVDELIPKLHFPTIVPLCPKELTKQEKLAFAHAQQKALRGVPQRPFSRVQVHMPRFLKPLKREPRGQLAIKRKEARSFKSVSGRKKGRRNGGRK